MCPMGPTIRRIAPEEVIDLRHEILRSGLPRDTAMFPGDTHPEARHYGAFCDGELIGCVTLHPSQWEQRPAWQLRGMAVAAGQQSRGVGRELLKFLEQDLSDSPVQALWCNARVPAARFYEKFGWRIVSEVFEIPTAGPHVKMIKSLMAR